MHGSLAMDVVESEVERLARGHVDLVYSAALRQLRGDAATASDVTQAVLLVLVRKGRTGSLPEERYMAGWLLKVTRYAVLQAKRAGARRERHERQAGQAVADGPTKTVLHEEIRAALDDSLLSLGATDREVVVRRYLEGQSVAEVAKAVGVAENTAGRRIARAMEKLRRILLRRGIVAPGAALAAVMGIEATVKASAASVAAGPAAAELAKHLVWRLIVAKVKAVVLGIGAAVAVGGAVAAALEGSGGPGERPVVPAAGAAAAEWMPTPVAVEVVREVQASSDALVQEVLAGLRENMPKLQRIHVRGTAEGRVYDAQNKTWVVLGRREGEAWQEAEALRRVHAVVTREFTRSYNGPGQIGPAQEASFVEAWDGATARREFKPPFSTAAAETHDRRYLKREGLLAAPFSMQLGWDEEWEARAEGSRATFAHNPLDPAVLAKRNLAARRVALASGREAVELTTRLAQDGVERVETFWFDAARGYGLLARRSTLITNGATVRTQTRVVESLAEAAPGVFYPAKAALLWEERGEPFLREEFTASEVRANEVAPAGLFTLEFTGGVPIVDYKSGKGTQRGAAPKPQ